MNPNPRAGAAPYLEALDADEKKPVTRSTPGTLGLFEGAAPRLKLISEPGLYKLISRSTKPDAKAFDRWVRHEVLPSIRKTGSYDLADNGREAMPLPLDIAEALAAFTASQQEANRLLHAFAGTSVALSPSAP